MNMTEDVVCNAIVLYPALTADSSGDAKASSLRSSGARLDEAVSLAVAINLNVVHSEVINITSCRPATYIGKGSVDKIKGLVGAFDAGLVIMDCPLSPMQQRNLEKEWNVKVIDRTALILEIFGERANTREGVLQVELAHLTYQKSRLVRSWTHLERQRGGAGFLGGPGEKQIEMDRRIISDKIAKLKKELDTVKRTRHLHRKARQRVPYPVVALVGYTNAGKSTLFNRITGADVYAENKLFATLDPTMRQIRLPNGTKAILSDTVGFISELPTELVAAFRATLEEVLEADIILHVRDIVHIDTLAQKNDVINILKSLGLEDKTENSMIEVMNKVDLLDKLPADNDCSKRKIVHISALDGTGIKTLLTMVENELGARCLDLSIRLKPDDGAAISWLYRHGEVVKRQDKDDCIVFHVRMGKAEAQRFKAFVQDKK